MPLPTLLLLPGLLCDAAVWQHQVDHLRDVVNIIIPDFSRASTPQEMLAAALDAAPPAFSLAGHSMGGWVALEIMKSAPQRVEKLCLLNTTAKPDSPEKSHARREMITLTEQGHFDAVMDRVMPVFAYQKQILPVMLPIFKRNQPAFIRQQSAMLARGDCIAVLQTITCPTLIIHSTHDAVFSLSDAELLHHSIKGSSLQLIDDAGHMSMMEQPEKVAKCMRAWLVNS